MDTRHVRPPKPKALPSRDALSPSSLFTPLTRTGYWVAYLSPLAGLLGLALIDRGLARLWPTRTADIVTFLIAIILTLLYSHGFLSRIKVQYAEISRLFATSERQRERLRLLQEAMTTIAQDRDWETILQRVVELSRELTGARYGALAALNPDETIARFITSGMSPEEIHAIGSLPRGKGLLGEVIKTRRALRVDNIQRHPASTGWPAGHPPMATFLGMPILFRDQVVGHLYLTEKTGGSFTQDDEELVALLASQAAVLITNARLNRELERMAVVDERQRIGMDLHDGTIQALYGVMLTIDTLLSKIPPKDPLAIRTTLDDLGDRISTITNDIRHYIFDLKQDRQDWQQEAESIIQELGLKDSAHVHTADRRFRELSPHQLDNVLAFLREALTNAARHARARHVDVTWMSSAEGFRMVIEDNGRGFDPHHAVDPSHFGLQHLDQRARDLGGESHILSHPGDGTKVELLAPFQEPPRQSRPAPSEEAAGPPPSRG